jgi:hypothetical protein
MASEHAERPRSAEEAAALLQSRIGSRYDASTHRNAKTRSSEPRILQALMPIRSSPPASTSKVENGGIVLMGRADWQYQREAAMFAVANRVGELETFACRTKIAGTFVREFTHTRRQPAPERAARHVRADKHLSLRIFRYDGEGRLADERFRPTIATSSANSEPRDAEALLVGNRTLGPVVVTRTRPTRVTTTCVREPAPCHRCGRAHRVPPRPRWRG